MQQLSVVGVALATDWDAGQRVADAQFLADAGLDGRVVVRHNDAGTGDLGLLHRRQVRLGDLDVGGIRALLLQRLVAVVRLHHIDEALAFAGAAAQLDALLLQILHLVDDLLQFVLLGLNFLLQLSGNLVALLDLGDGQVVLLLEPVETVLQLQLQESFSSFTSLMAILQNGW